MSSDGILSPSPVRNLKRPLTDLDSDWELPNPLPSSPYTHPRLSNTGKRLKPSLLRAFDHQHRPAVRQLTADSNLSAWLNAVPDPRPISCPATQSALPNSSAKSLEAERPGSCPPYFDLVRPRRATNGDLVPNSIEPNRKRARLTLTAFQEMSQQQSQYSENTGPRSISSSNKQPGTSDAAYIDTLYGHGIIIDPSGRKIPKELENLKSEILKQRSSPQLDEEAIFGVMDTAEELAYSSEGPTNKILRLGMVAWQRAVVLHGILLLCRTIPNVLTTFRPLNLMPISPIHAAKDHLGRLQKTMSSITAGYSRTPSPPNVTHSRLFPSS